IKIILDSSSTNGWIAINPIDKIITKPFHVVTSLSPVHIKYDKVASLKYKESVSCIDCELILEPYNVLSVDFYPRERNNVDTLIDTLYDDLPQSENEMYTTCFFKKSDIPSNRKICHVKINNIDIDFGSRCYIWRDENFLSICNTVIRNGVKIKIPNIKYYRITGDKYVTTEVTGGGGGGTSIKGAIIGGIIAGEAGAIIGSRKPIESVKSSSTVHDKQSVLMYSNNSSMILKFNSEVYDVLLDLLPEKEYEYTIHETKESSPNTPSDTTDTKSKLKELKSMFEEDLITEEEYNSKKQELLSKM
ncbi:MAG: SHOCT domain-containing protein, partial [Bacilli bacterium]|nr:SHOCT domain-containing protein [Bacilli bacterium]